jgi:hypothetical protein
MIVTVRREGKLTLRVTASAELTRLAKALNAWNWRRGAIRGSIPSLDHGEPLVIWYLAEGQQAPNLRELPFVESMPLNERRAGSLIRQLGNEKGSSLLRAVVFGLRFFLSHLAPTVK